MAKLVTLIAVLLALAAAPSQAAAEGPGFGAQGLHAEPWFHVSFLDLADDLADANAQGKRLALVWEQKGCPYCAQMHKVHLADPATRDYIRRNFLVVQLDLRGDRQVTDFDGQVLTEKELARKYNVVGTPTIQFLPDSLSALSGKKIIDAEVARMPGLQPADRFLAFFEYVGDRQYRKASLQNYLKSRAEAE